MAGAFLVSARHSEAGTIDSVVVRSIAGGEFKLLRPAAWKSVEVTAVAGAPVPVRLEHSVRFDLYCFVTKKGQEYAVADGHDKAPPASRRLNFGVV